MPVFELWKSIDNKDWKSTSIRISEKSRTILTKENITDFWNEYCIIEEKLDKKCFYELRKARDFSWRERERKRIGAYSHCSLPRSWARFVYDEDGMFRERYLHVNEDKPRMVCFTESEEKGQLHIHTYLRPGRYLARYHPDLTMEQQRLLCAEFDAFLSPELKITKDPKEISEVYDNGPHSCMAASQCERKWDFDEKEIGFNNPAGVYGFGDLAVAYIGPREKAEARSVVWPERKIYSRVYGHSAKLIVLLEKEGYKCGYTRQRQYDKSKFIGAKIKAVFCDEEKSQIVMPYVDVALFGKSTENGYIELVHSAAFDKNLIVLQKQTGSTEYVDERKRCAISRKLIKDEDTVVSVIDYGDCLESMAFSSGFRPVENGLWTNNFVTISAVIGEVENGVRLPADYVRYVSVRYYDDNYGLFFRDQNSGKVYFRKSLLSKVCMFVNKEGAQCETTIAFMFQEKRTVYLYEGVYYATKRILKTINSNVKDIDIKTKVRPGSMNVNIREDSTKNMFKRRESR